MKIYAEIDGDMQEVIPFVWYPHIDPACSKGRAIAHDKPACGEFELMGRMSR